MLGKPLKSSEMDEYGPILDICLVAFGGQKVFTKKHQCWTACE